VATNDANSIKWGGGNIKKGRRAQGSRLLYSSERSPMAAGKRTPSKHMKKEGLRVLQITISLNRGSSSGESGRKRGGDDRLGTGKYTNSQGYFLDPAEIVLMRLHSGDSPTNLGGSAIGEKQENRFEELVKGGAWAQIVRDKVLAMNLFDRR